MTQITDIKGYNGGSLVSHIAHCIEYGRRQGSYLTSGQTFVEWELDCDEKRIMQDADAETIFANIASLIMDGLTQGISPYWRLIATEHELNGGGTTEKLEDLKAKINKLIDDDITKQYMKQYMPKRQYYWIKS